MWEPQSNVVTGIFERDNKQPACVLSSVTLDQLGVNIRLLEEHHVDEGDQQVGRTVLATIGHANKDHAKKCINKYETAGVVR